LKNVVTVLLRSKILSDRKYKPVHKDTSLCGIISLAQPFLSFALARHTPPFAHDPFFLGAAKVYSSDQKGDTCIA
jgi:hypothetical protein